MSSASYTIEVKPAGSWVAVAAGDVLDVAGSWELSGNRANAVAFGDDTDASMRAQFVAGVWSSLGDKTPIRYTTTIDADTTRTFTGVITKLHRDLDTCDIEALGMKVLIGATKAYSPAFARRPVATKTTATSVDDPTAGGYAGGIINYILWSAGGRPNEQAGSYPSATFYYSCDTAVLAPDWTWAAGEDGWAECLALSRASGGQMYQDATGVVRYKQVLWYGGGTALETFDESIYATIEQTLEPRAEQASKITCQYVQRRRLGTQQIADDTTPVHLEAGETKTIVIEPQIPIASLETQTGSAQLKPEALVVAQLDGTRLAQGTGYTHTLDIKAGRVTIAITNASAKPATVWRVLLRGDPIAAGEAGSVSTGAGTIERVLESSVYIQSRAHALRLAEMVLAFYATARPVVQVTGCMHKPSRAPGQTVNVTCAAWSMSASPHVILSVQHDQTGAEASYDLAYVGDLPKADDFFIVGVGSAGSKKLGW